MEEHGIASHGTGHHEMEFLGTRPHGTKSSGMEYHGREQHIAYPQGIKWTRQRKRVYQVLLESTEPLSAPQIYSRVEQHPDEAGGAYALSTIYRILSTFEEQGLVNKTNWMGDGTIVYELNRGGHTHYAVCLECHKRIPLSGCPFAHVHLEEQAEDFTITGHKLELYGYCKDCRALPQKDSKNF